MKIEPVLKRVQTFREIVSSILAKVETSPTRIITVENSYVQLEQLSLKQDDLFRQALRCAENGLYRAAHVMAWAAFVDFIHFKLAEDGFVKLRKARPKWTIKAVEDLREISDYQIIEACANINLIRRTEKRALHGLLNKRNECAHPEDFYPGINESLGYLSELIQRIGALTLKKL